LSAWRYRPAPWTDESATLPCQACGQAPGMVAVYEGLVWHATYCTACARLHQEGHALQLELFGEEEPSDTP
jgi:hypothetical protein